MRTKLRSRVFLYQIQASYDGQKLYPTLANKAAWLFYCLTKNHCFSNDNKRIATLATAFFLEINIKELFTEDKKDMVQSTFLYLSTKVAESNASDSKIMYESYLLSLKD